MLQHKDTLEFEQTSSANFADWMLEFLKNEASPEQFNQTWQQIFNQP